MNFDYIAPEWNKAGRVHDWRNYVSDELKAAWSTLSMWQQKILRDNFQSIADKEDWD